MSVELRTTNKWHRLSEEIHTIFEIVRRGAHAVAAVRHVATVRRDALAQLHAFLLGILARRASQAVRHQHRACDVGVLADRTFRT